jgi:hypothetical protein
MGGYMTPEQAEASSPYATTTGVVGQTAAQADAANRIGQANRAKVGYSDYGGRSFESLDEINQATEAARRQAGADAQYRSMSSQSARDAQAGRGEAYRMAVEAERKGETLDFHVAQKAIEQGYVPQTALFASSREDSRQTVPQRYTGEAQNYSSVLMTPGKGETYYVPYGDRAKTEIRNAAAVASPGGELSLYQLRPERPGFTPVYGHIVSGGGANALQSGMFTHGEGRAGTPVVYTQESAGTKFAPGVDVAKANAVLANPSAYSRSGAELYGGDVTKLDNRLKITASTRVDPVTGVQTTVTNTPVSTYPANKGNLAGLVDPFAVNLPKSERVGNAPWSIDFRTSPSVQMVDREGNLSAPKADRLAAAGYSKEQIASIAATPSVRGAMEQRLPTPRYGMPSANADIAVGEVVVDGVSYSYAAGGKVTLPADKTSINTSKIPVLSTATGIMDTVMFNPVTNALTGAWRDKDWQQKTFGKDLNIGTTTNTDIKTGGNKYGEKVADYFNAPITYTMDSKPTKTGGNSAVDALGVRLDEQYSTIESRGNEIDRDAARAKADRASIDAISSGMIDENGYWKGSESTLSDFQLRVTKYNKDAQSITERADARNRDIEVYKADASAYERAYAANPVLVSYGVASASEGQSKWDKQNIGMGDVALQNVVVNPINTFQPGKASVDKIRTNWENYNYNAEIALNTGNDGRKTVGIDGLPSNMRAETNNGYSPVGLAVSSGLYKLTTEPGKIAIATGEMYAGGVVFRSLEGTAAAARVTPGLTAIGKAPLGGKIITGVKAYAVPTVFAGGMVYSGASDVTQGFTDFSKGTVAKRSGEFAVTQGLPMTVGGIAGYMNPENVASLRNAKTFTGASVREGGVRLSDTLWEARQSMSGISRGAGSQKANAANLGFDSTNIGGGLGGRVKQAYTGAKTRYSDMRNNVRTDATGNKYMDAEISVYDSPTTTATPMIAEPPRLLTSAPDGGRGGLGGGGGGRSPTAPLPEQPTLKGAMAKQGSVISTKPPTIKTTKMPGGQLKMSQSLSTEETILARSTAGMEVQTAGEMTLRTMDAPALTMESPSVTMGDMMASPAPLVLTGGATVGEGAVPIQSPTTYNPLAPKAVNPPVPSPNWLALPKGGKTVGATPAPTPKGVAPMTVPDFNKPTTVVAKSMGMDIASPITGGSGIVGEGVVPIQSPTTYNPLAPTQPTAPDWMTLPEGGAPVGGFPVSIPEGIPPMPPIEEGFGGDMMMGEGGFGMESYAMSSSGVEAQSPFRIADVYTPKTGLMPAEFTKGKTIISGTTTKMPWDTAPIEEPVLPKNASKKARALATTAAMFKGKKFKNANEIRVRQYDQNAIMGWELPKLDLATPSWAQKNALGLPQDMTNLYQYPTGAPAKIKPAVGAPRLPGAMQPLGLPAGGGVITLEPPVFKPHMGAPRLPGMKDVPRLGAGTPDFVGMMADNGGMSRIAPPGRYNDGGAYPMGAARQFTPDEWAKIEGQVAKEKIRGKKYEVALLFGKDMNFLGKVTQRNPKHVRFTDNEVTNMKMMGVEHIVHNHPEKTSLSYKDKGFIHQQGFTSISAVTDGKTFTAFPYGDAAFPRVSSGREMELGQSLADANPSLPWEDVSHLKNTQLAAEYKYGYNADDAIPDWSKFTNEKRLPSRRGRPASERNRQQGMTEDVGFESFAGNEIGGLGEDVAQNVVITRPVKQKPVGGWLTLPEPPLANARAVFNIDGNVKSGYIGDIQHTGIRRTYVKGMNEITAEVGQANGFRPTMNYNLVQDEFNVIPMSKFTGGKRTSVVASNAHSWMGGAIDGGSEIALVARRVDTQELTGALGMDMPRAGQEAHVNLFGTEYNKIGVGDALFDAAEGIAKHKGASGINLLPSGFARDDWYVAKRGFPKTGRFTLPASKFHDTFATGHPVNVPTEKYKVFANVPGYKGTAKSATLIGTEGREPVILSFEEDLPIMGRKLPNEIPNAMETPMPSERFITPGKKHGGGGRTRPSARDMTRPSPIQRVSGSQSYMAKDVRGDFIRSPQVIDNRILASGGQMNQMGQVTPAEIMGHGIVHYGKPAPFNVVAAMGGEGGGGGEVIARGGSGATSRAKSRSVAVPGQVKLGEVGKKAAAETRKRVFTRADLSLLKRGSATSAKPKGKSYAIPSYDGSVDTGEETVIGSLQGAKNKGSGKYGAIGMLGTNSGVGGKAVTTPTSGIHAIATSSSRTAVGFKNEAGALARANSMSKALAAASADSLSIAEVKSRSGALAKAGSGGLAKSAVRPTGLSVPRTGGTSIARPIPGTTSITTPTPGTKTLTTPSPMPKPIARDSPIPVARPRPEPRPQPRPEPRPQPPIGGSGLPPIGGAGLPPFGFPGGGGAGGGEGTNYRGISGFREHSATWTASEMATSLFTGRLGGKPAPVQGNKMKTVYGKQPGYFKTHSGTVKVIPLKGQQKSSGTPARGARKGRNKGR